MSLPRHIRLVLLAAFTMMGAVVVQAQDWETTAAAMTQRVRMIKD